MAIRFERRHVEAAFDEIRATGIAPNAESTKWDILDPQTGDRFPPKAVLRVAKQLAGDVSFSGGGGPHTNNPLRAHGFEIVLKPWLEGDDETTDILEIIRATKDETTTKRLIDARLGQGGFRAALMEIWHEKCAYSGCAVTEVLRASHIKPWRESSNKERLDPDNGILLAATYDALFDKHLITFDMDGALIVSAQIDQEEAKALGLTNGMKVELNAGSQYFMKHHRASFALKKVG